MRTSLDEYLLATADGNGYIDALTATLAAFGKHARYASDSHDTPCPIQTSTDRSRSTWIAHSDLSLALDLARYRAAVVRLKLAFLCLV
ncbi:MAG: hypothetical protein ACJ797_18090 [Ktedonobacteraceae bacterium]